MIAFITERSLILGAVHQWQGNSYYTTKKKHKDILNKLKALDLNTATANEINEIVGSLLVFCSCDHCDSEEYPFVEIGERIPYECTSQTLCLKCMKDAVAVMGSL